MIEVFFIYADNCKHCGDALDIIKEAIKKLPEKTCKLLEFPYNSKVALKIAVSNDIDDLPGIVINKNSKKTVFKGKHYKRGQIEGAILG